MLCALGQSITEFWGNCLSANAAVTPIPDHWFLYSDYKSRIWSILPEIDFDSFNIRRVDLLKHDMSSILALCSAKQAIEQSGHTIRQKNTKDKTCEFEDLEPSRTGIFIGTSFGANSFLEAHAHQILKKPKNILRDVITNLDTEESHKAQVESVLDILPHAEKYHPLTVSRLMPNAVAATLGIKYSITGPTTMVGLACAAGTSAIGQGFRAIRDGYLDVVITGGSEYWNDYYGAIFRAFDVANTLVRNSSESEKANRPFDKGRSGFLFSQGGSAILILEDMEMAKRRGANILAEVVGFGETFDAYNMMSPAPGGKVMGEMLLGSLRDAKVDASRIDYVNAHGTGTIANDEVECSALECVFGYRPKVNSTKSLLGHTVGASGALEAVVTILSLQKQTTHICKNLVNPIADLNFVRGVEPNKFEYACTHSFAFGGHNAGLIIKRYHDDQ